MPKIYRTITLACEPNAKTREALDTAFEEVRDFAEVAMTEFQKTLYHKFKDEVEPELAMRVVSLLAQRYGKTLLKQELIPLDKCNYKLIKQNGAWFVEAKILKSEERFLIPIYKTDNRYYGMLLERSAFPATLFKEGGQYKLAIAVPIDVRFDANRPTVTIGINLTMWKHAACLYDGSYVWNHFYDTRWLDEKVKRIQKQISRLQRQKRLGKAAKELVRNKIAELNRKISSMVTKSHGEFITKLVEKADEWWEKGYNVVLSMRNLKGFGEISFHYPWLNYKLRSLLAWQKFANMLEPRGYYVVYPFISPTECHRCGEKGERVKRIFSCPNCGLKDFNAELNVARVVAKVGFERAKQRRFY